jgi:hypothetical protein
MDVDDLPETIDFNGPIGAPFSRSTMVRDRSFGWGAVNLRAMTHEKRSVSEARRGYGFAFGGSLKLGDKDTLMGQYTHVDGDIDQFYGFNGYAIAPGTGSITFDRNEGMVIGYAHVFSDKLRGNVSAGFNRGTSAQATDNRTLAYTFVNLIYSPVKEVDLGGEWIYGARKTFTEGSGTLSRFDLMARYSF